MVSCSVSFSGEESLCRVVLNSKAKNRGVV